MINLLNFLYIFIYIAPFTVIRYYPFRDRLRVSVRVLCIIYAAIIGVQAALFCYLSAQPYWNGSLLQTYRIGFACVYADISFLLVRENVFKQLYVWELMFAVASLTTTIANFVEARYFPVIAVRLPHAIEIAAITVQVLIYFPFIFKAIDKTIIPVIRSDNGKVWHIVWLAPAFLYSGTLLSTWNLDLDKVSTFTYLFIRIFCLASIVVVSIILSEALRQSDENARFKEHARMTEIQLALQADAYTNLEAHIAEVKAARHDLKHHLSVIEAYLQLDDKDSMCEYLNTYKSTLPEEKELLYCENRVANIIASHYAKLAKEDCILMTADLYIPKKVEIADMDICIVLGNCLENAIEACHRIKSGRKTISVKSEIRGNMMIILVDNSFNGAARMQDDLYLSSKRDGPGIGISSVKEVAKKYNGVARFEASADVFRVSVMLQMQL